MTTLKNVRKLVAAAGVAAATLAGTASLAAPAQATTTSAATVVTRVAIIPTLALNLDVAHGPEFALSQRDNSGISAGERWDIVDPGTGFVFLRNVDRGADGRTDFMDVNSFGDVIGTRTANAGISQQWIVVKNSNGSTSFKNNWTKRFLNFRGIGTPAAFVQSASNGPGAKFAIKKL